ncbi:MAG TPA: RagB/SusD family nutrient uptake outer membrane protein, partial [Chitinophagaceae bacterium]|nr:RagB/SusD family nutrient uptake outer membrane protein [Chitinophagaceae bacterium]
MKYFIIYGAIAVMLVLSACTKILDTNSPSDFTSALVFSNTTEAQKAVSGVYALFNQDAFTSRLSNNFTGDNDVEYGSVGAAPDNSRRDIWSFECTDANADLLTVWNNAYKAINAANEVVAGVNGSSIKSDPMMQHIKGEALTLRALWYYWLVCHWGDVPYKTTPSKAGDNFYLGRTGRDTILSNCIHELVDIEPNMYWADALDYGIERINREFVIGMIARLSLMRGGYWLYPNLTMKRKDDYQKYYDTANIYCKKLLSLKPHTMSDFATVFMNENKYVKPLNNDV